MISIDDPAMGHNECGCCLEPTFKVLRFTYSKHPKSSTSQVVKLCEKCPQELAEKLDEL